MWNARKKRKINPKTGKREYRRKSPLQRLEKKADDLTKEIVRLIYDWKCQKLSLIHISEPTRQKLSRMPSSA